MIKIFDFRGIGRFTNAFGTMVNARQKATRKLRVEGSMPWIPTTPLSEHLSKVLTEYPNTKVIRILPENSTTCHIDTFE